MLVSFRTSNHTKTTSQKICFGVFSFPKNQKNTYLCKKRNHYKNP